MRYLNNYSFINNYYENSVKLGKKILTPEIFKYWQKNFNHQSYLQQKNILYKKIFSKEKGNLNNN